MKATLTIEQSQKLIKLGVDPKLASDSEIYDEPCHRSYMAVFTLADILTILPKEIEYSGITYGLNIWVESAVWYVEYCAEAGVYDFLIGSNIDAPELIDALYPLLVWLKTERVVEI